MKMCLNWKVVGGLAAAGIGLFLVAPNMAAAALPFLVLAACPLSMLLMMGAMGGMRGGQCASEPQAVGGQINTTPVASSDIDGFKARLAELEDEQAALARAIAERERMRDEGLPRTFEVVAGTPSEPISGRA